MSFADFKLGNINPIILTGDSKKAQTTEQTKTEDPVVLAEGSYQPSSDVEAINKELADIMGALGIEGEIAEDEGAAGTLEEIGANQEAGEISNLPNVDSISLTDEAKEAIKEKMEALQEEYDKEVEKMEQIKEDIEDLADKVTENITKAAAAQEAAVKQNEQQAQAVVDEQLKAYIEANQEGGEGMTREQLQENIKGALPDAPNVSAALAAAVEANEQISEIDALLGELNNLTAQLKPIEDQLNAFSNLLGEDAAADAADATGSAANEQDGNKKCDPIGFVANGQEFNFFTDKDGDGALSQTNEFLGSQDKWAEMQAADLDEDGIVTAEELEKNNIQLAGKDGSVIKGADAYKKTFGEDFSINLESYDENGTYEGIDTTKDSNNNGVVDQELLGTFNVNVNGEEILGYNTDDDTEWLSENYGVEISEPAEKAEEAEETLKFDKVQEFMDFAKMAEEQNELAKKELAEIEEKLGFNTDTVAEYKDVVSQQTSATVASYVKSLDETQEENNDIVDEAEKEDLNNSNTDIDADATSAQEETKAEEGTTAKETKEEEELKEELEDDVLAA